MNTMDTTPTAILDAALSLSPEERAELASQLIASLEVTGTQQQVRIGLPVLSDEVKAKIERRIQEIDSGSVTLLDGEEVFQRLRLRNAQKAS